jgi:hypothetical protein
MFKGIKLIMSLFVILTIVVFCSSLSYSQQKPSEKTIKQIIIKGYSRSISQLSKNTPNIKLSDLKYDSFKITKGFFSKKPAKAGESIPYNIEVNYKISYIQSQNLKKWKADQIKQYKNNIRMLQEALKKHESQANKPKEMIKYDKDSINGNKKNIEEVKKYPDIKREKEEIVKNNERMNFIKKGNKWHGYLGWK